MKWRGAVLAIVAILLSSSISFANITDLTYASDGDGAFVCSNYWWSGSSASLTCPVSGSQYWGPGHLLGSVTTDSPDDPTLTIASAVDNDTAFAWTAYFVNVYMNTPFALSNVVVTAPGDWSVVSVTQPVLVGTNYVGSMEFDTGTPIPNGGVGELGFSYQMQFGSSTHYSFTQEMIPVPEPGAMGLVAVGGVLLASLRRVRPQPRA